LSFSNYCISPMYEESILGNTPKIPLASFSFSLLKVGIPLVKINISQCFKYLKRWKILTFKVGIPTFKNETRTKQWMLLWVIPNIFSLCKGPMCNYPALRHFIKKNLYFLFKDCAKYITHRQIKKGTELKVLLF